MGEVFALIFDPITLYAIPRQLDDRYSNPDNSRTQRLDELLEHLECWDIGIVGTTHPSRQIYNELIFYQENEILGEEGKAGVGR